MKNFNPSPSQFPLFSYYEFPSAFSNDYINDYLNQFSSLSLSKAVVLNNQDIAKLSPEENQEIQSSRRSHIKWVPENEKFKSLYDSFKSYLKQANNNYFHFNIDNYEDDLQYTEYNSNIEGYYGWHIDLDFTRNEYQRKLSLVLQLSDPNEYEGGDLEIHIPDPENFEILKIPKEKGRLIIFPSYLWHRVTPVTKGIRKSLVWWVGGVPFR